MGRSLHGPQHGAFVWREPHHLPQHCAQHLLRRGTWGSFAEETPDVFGGGSESGKSLSDGSEGKCVSSEDNEQLTDVISGVCLLGSLEDVGNTCNRRQAFSGSIKIVKSVLHRQVP